MRDITILYSFDNMKAGKAAGGDRTFAEALKIRKTETVDIISNIWKKLGEIGRERRKFIPDLQKWTSGQSRKLLPHGTVFP